MYRKAPYSPKLAAYRFMTNRVFMLPSLKTDLTEELHINKAIAYRNSYKQKFIDEFTVKNNNYYYNNFLFP